jgi:hypothetical protein
MQQSLPKIHVHLVFPTKKPEPARLGRRFRGLLPIAHWPTPSGLVLPHRRHGGYVTPGYSRITPPGLEEMGDDLEIIKRVKMGLARGFRNRAKQPLRAAKTCWKWACRSGNTVAHQPPERDAPRRPGDDLQWQQAWNRIDQNPGRASLFLVCTPVQQSLGNHRCISEPQRGSPRIAGGFNPRGNANQPRRNPGGVGRCG